LLAPHNWHKLPQRTAEWTHHPLRVCLVQNTLWSPAVDEKKNPDANLVSSL
jgi:hypothetical protein